MAAMAVAVLAIVAMMVTILHGLPLNPEKTNSINSLMGLDNSCFDCAVFNRQRGTKTCASDVGDCGPCLPGYRADIFSQGREAEICSKIKAGKSTSMPSSGNSINSGLPPTSTKWSIVNASSANTPNFTSMTESGLTFGLVVASLAIVVCVIGAVSKMVFSAKYSPIRGAAAAEVAQPAGEHGQRPVIEDVHGNDEGQAWPPGMTILSSEVAGRNGRSSSVPTSSAYSSMTTLDIPLGGSSSMAPVGTMAPVMPDDHVPETAALLRAAPSTPETFMRHQQQYNGGHVGGTFAADHQETSNNPSDGNTNAEGSLNLFIHEGPAAAPWTLPTASPFYDNYVDTLGEGFDQSILRDAPNGNNFLQEPFLLNFSGQGPRLAQGNMNESVESLFLSGPFRPADLNDSRDDASLAETDPSDWEPPRNGMRSQRISEASDLFFVHDVETTTSRLASTHLGDAVDGPVPTPQPFRFPSPIPEPPTSSSANNTTTSDNNDTNPTDEEPHMNNFDDTASIASSSMAFSSEAGGSSATMGDSHAGGRRRRCSEKEELMFSVKFSIKRSRLEEDYDETNH